MSTLLAAASAAALPAGLQHGLSLLLLAALVRVATLAVNYLKRR